MGKPLADRSHDLAAQARALADIVTIDEAIERRGFSSPGAELRYKLERIKAVVQQLIDAIDDAEGDADLEVDEDVSVDDVGEPDEAD